jgi:tetratricopeptide (TPR) repeat protein
MHSFAIAQVDKTLMAFSKSIEFEKKSDYAGAIQAMSKVEDTTTYELNIRLGWLYYKFSNQEKSFRYYRKAINIMPNAIEPRYGFSFPASLLKDYKDVIEEDRKILEIDPNNKIIRSNLGHIYYYKGDYTAAILHFGKCVSAYPFDYDNNLMLAWSYLKAGKSKEAEEYFNTTLLYSPTDASALEGLSNITRTIKVNEQLMDAFSKSYDFAQKADYKSAVNSIKEVYNQSSYPINLRLGWLCYLAGMQTESVDYYKIAIKLKPNAVEPKLGYIYPNVVLGNKTDLASQYLSILSIDPQNTSIHYKYGLLLYEKKDYQAALSHFEKVVNLYPTDADGLLMSAWANYQLGKTSESKKLFTKVLYFYPDNASALQGLNLKPVNEIIKNAGLKKL